MPPAARTLGTGKITVNGGEKRTRPMGLGEKSGTRFPGRPRHAGS